MKKIIYLANPYGFSHQESKLLPQFVEVLQSVGAEVWEPFARNGQVDVSREGCAYRVGQADLKDLINSDAIFAICNGMPPDEGVMIELCAAIALGKKTFLFRDDIRKCGDSGNYPLNLMLFTGLPEKGWRDYCYESLEEIKSPQKALVRWLEGKLK